MKRSEPSRRDRLRLAIESCERQLNRRGWTLGGGAKGEPQLREDEAARASPARESAEPPPAGWYADPEAEGVHRYWNGTEWTDSRVTTEGIVYREQAKVRASRVSPTGLFLAAVLLIGGGVCLWVAQNYKPTLGNELGLSGNSFVLTPAAYHTLMIVGIVCLVLGAIRLLTALLR